MGKTNKVKDTKAKLLNTEEKSLTEEAVEELRKLLHSSDPKLKIRAISLILRHTEKLKTGRVDDDLSYIRIVEEILKNSEDS